MATSTAHAASTAATPRERDDLINNYLTSLERIERRGVVNAVERQALAEKFDQTVLGNQVSILSRTPEGREQLYKLHAEGALARLNPERLERTLQSAYAANARLEAQDRSNEAAIVSAREDRKLEIGGLIVQRDFRAAQQRLDFYADLRLLNASEVEHLREEIAKPARSAASDPTIAGRVLLDTESINPRTSEAEIDELHFRYQRGEAGLSLADAIKAKSQLRQTRVAERNRVASEAQSFMWKQHEQAEQELRALLGIKPGIQAAVMQDDPTARLYSALLPELRSRSQAFGGKESPLAVVESMRPRIDTALGRPVQLKPNEILGLYPDWQSLERARRENKINENAFQEQLRLRQLGPPAAPSVTPKATPPATPQRRSRNFGTQ